MSLVVARKQKREGLPYGPSSSSTALDIDEKASITVHLSPVDSSDLACPSDDRRFWFQRTKDYDPHAIATQPSVFDDPELVEEYKPGPDWENIHRFDPSARWTWDEEHKVIKKLDRRIMVLSFAMIVALELDRSNIQQANADDFLTDLGLSRDDYNLGNTLFRLCYLLSEVPAQLIGKYLGADRWLPIQMTCWSIVASCQFWLQGKASFLVCRALIGTLSGGFTPMMILYLSYFYKHHELSIRLGFWYSGMSLADVVAGFLAYGILHMRGHGGKAGWRWLFLIEEIILVNRVIREDPSKGTMHNREPLTLKFVWQSFMDFDLWPLYIIGLTFLTPWTTIAQYFTLFMKDLGFGTFKTILLAIPYNVMQIVTRIALTYASEAFGTLAWMGVFAQLWLLPTLIYMNVVDFSQENKWIAWTILTLFLAYPSTHALQAGWTSRNANSVRSRAIAAAIYNMCTQLSGIIASNVYRDWDAPRYTFGNRVLVGLIGTNIVIFLSTKGYYMLRNRQRDRKWKAMTEEQRIDYIAATETGGNRRLDFRFAH
ncbi:hypothetical protein FE257_011584 [Aspergillus nanangensis]|uniref:Major facilitator superfamily (MFS) profile domain-containing protein n=1 Tax=Aspergillus nanangensis TaxID=2582783 RepID=A0AAD4CH00_ASPNN|nr:hypothetical protein FE257_011584 [Aspergillus nanangensis]